MWRYWPRFWSASASSSSVARVRRVNSAMRRACGVRAILGGAPSSPSSSGTTPSRAFSFFRSFNSVSRDSSCFSRPFTVNCKSLYLRALAFTTLSNSAMAVVVLSANTAAPVAPPLMRFKDADPDAPPPPPNLALLADPIARAAPVRPNVVVATACFARDAVASSTRPASKSARDKTLATAELGFVRLLLVTPFNASTRSCEDAGTGSRCGLPSTFLQRARTTHRLAPHSPVSRDNSICCLIQGSHMVQRGKPAQGSKGACPGHGCWPLQSLRLGWLLAMQHRHSPGLGYCCPRRVP